MPWRMWGRMGRRRSCGREVAWFSLAGCRWAAVFAWFRLFGCWLFGLVGPWRVLFVVLLLVVLTRPVLQSLVLAGPGRAGLVYGRGGGVSGPFGAGR